MYCISVQTPCREILTYAYLYIWLGITKYFSGFSSTDKIYKIIKMRNNNTYHFNLTDVNNFANTEYAGPTCSRLRISKLFLCKIYKYVKFYVSKSVGYFCILLLQNNFQTTKPICLLELCLGQ